MTDQSSSTEGREKARRGRRETEVQLNKIRTDKKTAET